MRGLSVQTSVLLGCLMISLSILAHGGVIKVGNYTPPSAAAPAAAPAQAGTAAGQKSEADYIKALGDQATKLGLDSDKFNKCLTSGEKATLVAADLTDGSSLGVQGTPSFFVNGKPLFIGASPFDQFKKAIDDELNGVASATDKKTVGLGNLPILGNQNAPVALVEFSDYECPFCGAFFKGAEAQIKKEYVDTGKVKLVYRDYPLNQIHPGAQKAAEAARCAGDQGKYWEFHDAVFSNQEAIF
jgi:protein-disulfide isomerase